jgi:hypothetical protein
VELGTLNKKEQKKPTIPTEQETLRMGLRSSNTKHKKKIQHREDPKSIFFIEHKYDYNRSIKVTVLPHSFDY